MRAIPKIFSFFLMFAINSTFARELHLHMTNHNAFNVTFTVEVKSKSENSIAEYTLNNETKIHTVNYNPQNALSSDEVIIKFTRKGLPKSTVVKEYQGRYCSNEERSYTYKLRKGYFDDLDNMKAIHSEYPSDNYSVIYNKNGTVRDCYFECNEKDNNSYMIESKFWNQEEIKVNNWFAEIEEHERRARGEVDNCAIM